MGFSEQILNSGVITRSPTDAIALGAMPEITAFMTAFDSVNKVRPRTNADFALDQRARDSISYAFAIGADTAVGAGGTITLTVTRNIRFPILLIRGNALSTITPRFQIGVNNYDLPTFVIGAIDVGETRILLDTANRILDKWDFGNLILVSSLAMTFRADTRLQGVP